MPYRYNKFLSRNLPYFSDRHDVLEKIPIPRTTWSAVVSLLGHKNKWKEVCVLVIGTGGKPGVAANCHYDKVDIPLYKLLQSLRADELSEWGEHLAIRLLSNGAEYRSVVSDNSSPLFACLDVGLKTGKHKIYVTY